MNATKLIVSRTFVSGQYKFLFLRKFSGSSSVYDDKNSIIKGLVSTSQWKKDEIRKITSKFQPISSTDTSDISPLQIEKYEDIQPMWRDMESRVTRRKTMTVEEAARKGKGIGRRNVRRTDEEAWLKAGLYGDKI